MYTFKAMTQELAELMIKEWKYPGMFSLYNYENEKDSLLDESLWGKSKFAVFNDDELIGELTIDFFDVTDGKDEYVTRDFYQSNKELDYEMWFGFGLKPDLTSKGLGQQFVEECMQFALSFNNYEGPYIRLAVSEFNERAIKVYQRLGFETFDTYLGEIDGTKVKTLWMKKVVN